MKYITDILVDKIAEDDKESIRAEYVASDKDKVLNYLKKFKASLFTSEPVIDVFTGKKVADADNGYTDGKYTWFESEVHYFEHYDLKLNEDFLESVKKAS